VSFNAVADNMGLSSFCLAVVASKICEILRNSPKIWTNGQTPLQHNSLTENTKYEEYTSTALIWINQTWYKL